MVRVSDWYSEGLGFKSQLDPRFFSVDIFLTLSTKNITYFCSEMTHCNFEPGPFLFGGAHRMGCSQFSRHRRIMGTKFVQV